jgi:hypothetical protein
MKRKECLVNKSGSIFLKEELNPVEMFVTEDGRKFDNAHDAREHERAQGYRLAIFDAIKPSTPEERTFCDMLCKNEMKIRGVHKIIGLNPSIVHAADTREAKAKAKAEGAEGKSYVEQEKVDPPIKDLRDLELPA